MAEEDSDRRGHLSKGIGQVARVAAAISALEQAVQSIAGPSDDESQCRQDTSTAEASEWSYSVSAQNVKCAEVIVNHSIATKFALMNPPAPAETNVEPAQYNDLTTFAHVNGKYIQKIFKHPEETFSMGIAAQKRFFPKPPGKRKHLSADGPPFFRLMQEHRLGTVKDSVHGKTKVATVKFTRARIDELPDAVKRILPSEVPPESSQAIRAPPEDRPSVETITTSSQPHRHSSEGEESTGSSDDLQLDD